jgi:hypothetical protein
MDTPRYRSLKKLATVTTVLLAGNAGLAALTILITLWSEAGGTEEVFSEESVDSTLAVLGFIALIAVTIFVGTVVSFCMFVHRAASNLRALGRTGLQFTPGWAVGWFFVPFANLFKPYHAIKEIVLASDPDTQKSEYSTTWMTNPLPQIVGAWWAFWVIRMIVDRIASKMETTVIEFDLFMTVIEFISVATAILLVQHIARQQEALAAKNGSQLTMAGELGHVVNAPTR